MNTKRDVLIARALLAQRLNVIDLLNSTIGSRIDPEYLKALRRTDTTISMAPDGILPSEISREISLDAASDLDIIIITTKANVVEYQQELNQNIMKIAEERKERAEDNLLLLVSLFILTTIFLIWVGRSFLINLRATRTFIAKEVELLNEANTALVASQSALRTLEDLNEAKNDFISTINHELRTPLTAIIGYTDLLQDEPVIEQDVQLNKFVSVLSKNASVLLDLVESILSLSGLDANRKGAPNVETDLLKILEKSIFVLTPQAEAKNIKVNVEANPDLEFSVNGNASQLSQLFINLISNAIKFSPDGSTVTIRFERVVSDKMVPEIQISIIDKGIGIPKADIPELFGRFYRASNAVSSHISGTGLGLAIVAKLVELHSATIRVESIENVGSTFIVNIPAFLTPVEATIFLQRGDVLNRAIKAILNSDIPDLPQICHQMSGAVGLYGLDQLGSQIAELGTWSRDNSGSKEEILEKKVSLVRKLKDALTIIRSQENI